MNPDILQPLVKIAALLITGYSVHRSLSPPNPPPAPKTCIDKRTLFERAIRYVTYCSKMMTWIAVVGDALATASVAFPSPLSRPLGALLLPPALGLPQNFASAAANASALPPLLPPSAVLLTPSALLLLGAAATAAGAVLRVACFAALGALFTFELTIDPAHRLVTHGPYAWVRHPSYSGVFATLLGASAAMLAPGAWLREAWLAPGLAGVLGHGAGAGAGWARPLLAWAFALFWATKVFYALKSTARRVTTEDVELRRVFGAQWEEWAARVRWRLCPGVY
ncbi:uncharacterized protein BXZ73DRAFT_105724 [Epithele typhae]|uniref:uncharacterized protein n=1 Tax=Epithele typhae TaxID=378194 RepID=UPI002007B169|nr:uncharacterized protein BXZ73DRAFT_105724 [Epithele typhae]KAH9916746.1 hypothetical protein BXZ73DRAFT_105724 [Epithele typhae]